MLRGFVIKLHPNFAQSRFKQYFVTKRISRLSLERRKGQKEEKKSKKRFHEKALKRTNSRKRTNKAKH